MASLIIKPETASVLWGLAAGVAAGGATLFLIDGVVGFGLFLAAVGYAAYRGLEGNVWEEAPPRADEAPAASGPDALIPMVAIEGGTFLMGSPWYEWGRFRNEGPRHPVTVSPFQLGVYAVRRADWREVMDREPEEWKRDSDDGDLPANHTTWLDAVEFCNRLSEREGLLPCYAIDGDTVIWGRGTSGYRLPTEAEWEFAARARTKGRWFFRERAGRLGEYAWYRANSGNQLHPVARKKPNPYGLYDIHGNVWEWCWDWFDDYRAEPQEDPAGPETGELRVLRGGSAWDVARVLRAACRCWFGPGRRGGVIGFRVARSRPPAL